MEKQNYSLADELISAEEARLKLRHTRNGVIGDLFTINKIIKEAIVRGRPFITADELQPEVANVLTERGYEIEQSIGTKVRIIIDRELYDELSGAAPYTSHA